jgi:glycosyltransferase involved in cell wall biosynthesis
LARECRLACRFGTSEAGSLDYLDNLAASDVLLTTSVAEGFGMVFLEAALCDRPLTGRDLPEITADFKRLGVRFPWLTAGVTLPRAAVDVAAARVGLANAYAGVRHAYGFPGDAAQWLPQVSELIEHGPLDFAMLTPQLQMDLLRRVAAEANLRETLLEENPHVFRLPDRLEPTVAANVAHNASVVDEHFGLQSSGRRLAELYEIVMASKQGRVAPPEGGDAILTRFLDIRRLHPVRLET